MVVRLGIATGRGHAAMIYQRFGKWWGRFSLADLELVNFLTLVTEFAAIDLALSKVGVPGIVSVPFAAIGLIVMVVTGSYLRWERISVALCVLNVGWIIFAIMARPGAGNVFGNVLVPHIPEGGITSSLVFLLIAIVGTTVAPWQLFFQQSCIADKRLRFRDLNRERLDTFLGAAFTITNAVCMMIVGNVLHVRGIPYTDPAQMAVVLGPILGNFVKYGVLLLMVNAAVLGATAITLASSWAFGEVMGWPHSLQRPIKDAPGLINWSVIIVLFILSAVLAVQVMLPNLFPSG
jgi:Mn2+/Fe2+ NRAMP family transporter